MSGSSEVRDYVMRVIRDASAPLRQRALELACGRAEQGEAASSTIDRAQTFYEWLRGPGVDQNLQHPAGQPSRD